MLHFQYLVVDLVSSHENSHSVVGVLAKAKAKAKAEAAAKAKTEGTQEREKILQTSNNRKVEMRRKNTFDNIHIYFLLIFLLHVILRYKYLNKISNS